MKKTLQKLAGLFGTPRPSALSPATASQAPAQPAASASLAPGDIIIQHKDRKGWCTIKILAIDEFDGYPPTAHCLTYEYTNDEPTLVALAGIGIRAWHVPIAADSFAQGWQKLGNQPPSHGELDGFTEYLKLTDFPRYLEFTGQDAGELVNRANAHYREGCALHDQGKRMEAMQEYERAVDLFPLFFEAIDNRAFALMELGLYDRALPCFQESLRVNPGGMAAFFSKGECLMRLGRLDEAEQVFAAGLDRFPDHRAHFQRFLGAVQDLKNPR